MIHGFSKNASVEALLRGLKGSISLNALEVGFHLEKDAFLHIIDIWKMFVKRSLDYANSNLENTDKQGEVFGNAEIWRGIPDSCIGGFSLNSEVPLLSTKNPCVKQS